jgi:hypothetical protein
MPKIPIFRPTTPKTREVPGVRAPAEFGMAPFAQLERSGQEIAYVGARLIEAHRSTEYARHISESAGELQNIQLSFEQDPDIWTVEQRAKQAVEDFKQKRLGEIRDPILAKEFGPTFDRLALSTLGQITRHTQKRQIDDTKASTLTAIEGLEQAYYGAGSDAQASALLAQIKGVLAGQVQAGVFSAVEAEVLWKNLRQGMVKNSVIADIMDDPEGTLAELEAKKYDGLEEADRLSLIKAASTEIKLRHLARAAEEAKVAAAAKAMKEEEIRGLQDSFIARLQTGELTAEEILKSGLDPVGGGSKDFFLKALEAKAKGEMKEEKGPFEVSDPEVYATTFERISTGQIGNEAEILSMMGSGLSAKDTEHLIGKWREYNRGVDDVYKRSVKAFSDALRDDVFDSYQDYYEAVNEFDRRVTTEGLKGQAVEDLTKQMLWPHKEKSFMKKVKAFFFGEQPTETTDEKPDPKENKGKIIRDTETGKRYESDGNEWKEIE